MRQDLQYLNTLKTFEVTAQLLSFTKSADSLCVTQAAVSHQIRKLEEYLGLKLFSRGARQVVLTEEGKELLATLTQAFSAIENTMEQLRQGIHARNHLTLALSPAFSTRWLVSRLSEFWAQHPGLDIKLHHTLQHLDLRRGQVNAAIRWGDGQWPGLIAEPMFGTNLSPVCTPGYINPARPLVTAHDLSSYTLLHEDSHADWRRWIKATGCPHMDTNCGPIIDDSNALLIATLAGQGIALGRLALLQPELESGKLIRPFATEIESHGQYWLVYDETQKSRPALLAFRSFLQLQISLLRD
jgi:DNA-binding transcriptional LysR family regulator